MIEKWIVVRGISRDIVTCLDYLNITLCALENIFLDLVLLEML